MNLLEKTGFVLVVIGTLLLIFGAMVDNVTLQKIAEYQQLFYWLGLGLWALGYMQREKPKKKADC